VEGEAGDVERGAEAMRHEKCTRVSAVKSANG
jgi:hypothetical protein